MLCEECNQREATLFLTQILNGQTQKVSLCEVCGADILKFAENQYPGGTSFNPLADRLRVVPETFFKSFPQADSRYKREAYALVLRAVAHAFQAAPHEVHLPASTIAEAFREVALAEFGLQALPTLASWGIHSCDDIGIIVFDLVRAGPLGSRSDERAEDFSGLYDFATVFPTGA